MHKTHSCVTGGNTFFEDILRTKYFFSLALRQRRGTMLDHLSVSLKHIFTTFLYASPRERNFCWKRCIKPQYFIFLSFLTFLIMAPFLSATHLHNSHIQVPEKLQKMLLWRKYITCVLGSLFSPLSVVVFLKHLPSYTSLTSCMWQKTWRIRKYYVAKDLSFLFLWSSVVVPCLHHLPMSSCSNTLPTLNHVKKNLKKIIYI